MDFKTNWKKFFEKKSNILIFAGVIIVLIVTLSLFSRFILFVEERKGVSYNDPILEMFNAIELNWVIFGLVYLSILSSVIYFSKYPEMILKALIAYTMLVWIRALLMYVLPLEPPPGTIDLKDPLVFIVGTQKPITKDLFFSGHTSILFLIFLLTKNIKLKTIYLIAAILVGAFVMLQKAHYSVDVFVAPFISFAVYKISDRIFTKSQ